MTVTIPWWVLGSLAALASAVIIYVVGNFHGYSAGVRDTELRWADAVGRKRGEGFE